jgi:uncharacterized protein YcbX
MSADLLLHRVGPGETRIVAQSPRAAMFLAEGDPIEVVDSHSLRFILRRCDELGMTYRVGRVAR